MKTFFWTAVIASALVVPYLLLKKRGDEQPSLLKYDDSQGYDVNDYLDDAGF